MFKREAFTHVSIFDLCANHDQTKAGNVKQFTSGLSQVYHELCCTGLRPRIAHLCSRQALFQLQSQDVLPSTPMGPVDDANPCIEQPL